MYHSHTHTLSALEEHTTCEGFFSPVQPCPPTMGALGICRPPLWGSRGGFLQKRRQWRVINCRAWYTVGAIKGPRYQLHTNVLLHEMQHISIQPSIFTISGSKIKTEYQNKVNWYAIQCILCMKRGGAVENQSYLWDDDNQQTWDTRVNIYSHVNLMTHKSLKRKTHCSWGLLKTSHKSTADFQLNIPSFRPQGTTRDSQGPSICASN